MKLRESIMVAAYRGKCIIIKLIQQQAENNFPFQVSDL